MRTTSPEDGPSRLVSAHARHSGTHRPTAATEYRALTVAGGDGEVYHWCMSRTNIDLDDEACLAVMERFNLDSKRDAFNLALRRLAAEPLDLEAARRLRGSGWDGDLEEIRADRAG